MAADLAKCRSGVNYREGSAVSVQPAIASPSTKILSVIHPQSKDDKNWEDYFTNVIAGRWEEIGYYYNVPV